MSTYPTSPRSALLDWCQAHDNLWVTNATSIGLTPAQATAFLEATAAAAAATIAQNEAKQAAKVATQTAEDAFATLRMRLGDSVKLIRAFAINAPNPLTVYNLAQINPPAPASPAPPPAQPTELAVQLDAAMGALILSWKATNPANTGGTSYMIRRRMPGESAFTFIGVTGTKSFVDDTIVGCVDSVQYTVQGTRSNLVGPVSSIFTVNFGQSPDGAATVSVSAAAGSSYAADKALVDAIVRSKPNPNAHANGNGSGSGNAKPTVARA